MTPRPFVLSVALALVACGRVAAPSPSPQEQVPAPAAPDRPSGTLRARTYALGLEHEGSERRFVMHIPARYDRINPVPLVVVLHAGGEDPNVHARYALSHGGLRAAAEQQPFIAVFAAETSEPFVRALVAHIEARLHIDRVIVVPAYDAVVAAALHAGAPPAQQSKSM